MRITTLMASLLFFPACAPPALGEADVNWIRIQHAGEYDTVIPSIYLTTERMHLDDSRDLPQQAVLSPSDYEIVLANIRRFAERPDLKALPSESESSFGTFVVTEYAGGTERRMFTIAMPDSCAFLAAIVGDQRADEFDALKEMTTYTSQRLFCPGNSAD